MLTDPVYEGKSMAGLIDLVSRAEIEKRATVLYAPWAVSRRSTPTAPSSAERSEGRGAPAYRSIAGPCADVGARVAGAHERGAAHRSSKHERIACGSA